MSPKIQASHSATEPDRVSTAIAEKPKVLTDHTVAAQTTSPIAHVSDEKRPQVLQQHGSFSRFSKWFEQSRIGMLLIQGNREIEEFFAPIGSGFILTMVLFAHDFVNTKLGRHSDNGFSFVERSVAEIKVEFLVYGLGLMCLCLTFTDWSPTKYIRRFILLPLLRFFHHLVLVSAGAVLALLLSLIATHGEAATIGMAISGLIILLGAGCEMQAGCRYAELSQDKLVKMLPVPVQIGLGIFALVLFFRW